MNRRWMQNRQSRGRQSELLYDAQCFIDHVRSANERGDDIRTTTVSSNKMILDLFSDLVAIERYKRQDLLKREGFNDEDFAEWERLYSEDAPNRTARHEARREEAKRDQAFWGD